MSKKLIDIMVNRFLSWKLPKDFSPDAGISFKPTKPYEGDELGNSWWPIGTNLFTAEQAKAMFEHCLDGTGYVVEAAKQEREAESRIDEALRAAIEAAERQEPDGYISIVTDEDGISFGFADADSLLVNQTVNDKIVRLQDNEIPVPKINVKPFWLSPQPAPAGMVLVPVEPTEEMILAGLHHENIGDMEGRYKAMLAAAKEMK